MNVFSKPSLPIQELLQQWRQRGLVVVDERKAEHYLAVIGYYRLSAYTLPFQIQNSDHCFRQGITFEHILDLYEFDRELRLLVMDAVERIEIAFRSVLNNHMALNYGAHWYLNEQLFRRKYCHKSLLSTLERESQRSKEVFLRHYRKQYDSPRLPASWMIVETLSFGQLSIIYENLVSQQDQKRIAQNFCIHAEVLRSWMQSLSYVRNLCAHHARLWNRELANAPKIPQNPQNLWVCQDLKQEIDASRRIYLVFVVLMYLLSSMNLESRWRFRLKGLIERYPVAAKENMGIPKGWVDDPFWQFEGEGK